MTLGPLLERAGRSLVTAALVLFAVWTVVYQVALAVGLPSTPTLVVALLIGAGTLVLLSHTTTSNDSVVAPVPGAAVSLAVLGVTVVAKFARSGKPFRWVWTGRNRGHLYPREQEPSAGKVWRGIWRYQDEKKNWQEKEVHGELRCRGQQVAAPPTPGYILAAECPPQPVETVQKAWDAICLALGITPIKQEGGGNYRPAWQGQVPDGSRNNSLFVEACKLAAVRMPYERAVELLRLNVELHYEAGEKMTRDGFEATIRSAFQKAWPQRPGPATDERRKRELR